MLKFQEIFSEIHIVMTLHQKGTLSSFVVPLENQGFPAFLKVIQSIQSKIND
jgi:hypothetical protein